MSVRAEFMYRGVAYGVNGWLWATDGAQNGYVVHRADGRPIRGTAIRPGMVQIGLSRSLSRCAESALDAARKARSTLRQDDTDEECQ